MDTIENKETLNSVYQDFRTLLTKEEIFHIFSVVTEERKACIVSVVIQKETNQPFCESPQRPETTREQAKATISHNLQKLDLKYKTYEKEDKHREIVNYFISRDENRLTNFDENTNDDIEIGVFLNYPRDAIEWYVSKKSRISDLREWHLKFTAVSSYNQQPHMVEKFNYIEYIPAPTKQSYREAFKTANSRHKLAKKLDRICDTNAFSGIQYTNQRKPVEYGFLYALFRLSFEQNNDRK